MSTYREMKKPMEICVHLKICKTQKLSNHMMDKYVALHAKNRICEDM